MDENSIVIESILREQEEAERSIYGGQTDDTHEWKTVSYKKKRNRKSSTPLPSDNSADHHVNGHDSSADVFRSIEQHFEERRRLVVDVHMAAAALSADTSASRSKRHSDDDDKDAEVLGVNVENGSSEVKKVKKKKPKKPKMTVAEAASKINADDLSTFLADITASYDSQQDIQVMRFADYFGRAFSSVSGAQFPWLKMLKESSVAKIVDIPLSHISEDVYKISTDWISQQSSEALGSFVLWSLDSIFEGNATHQGLPKGSKKVIQQAPPKSQYNKFEEQLMAKRKHLESSILRKWVAIFVVLAMVLRRKPNIMVSLLPTMKDSQKYQGQDRLPVTIWVIAQASEGDLVVGLYLWASLLLPMLSGKSGCNLQSRDLILQLVERFLSFPKARSILLNGAVRKGGRVVPPLALETLLRVTFPLPSARVKVTERFESVYSTLKEVALAGSPGSQATKQLAEQLLTFVIKVAGEANSDLSREASDIFIWCLTENPECYKQWDMLYMDNLEASIVVLRKLSADWKDLFVKHPTLDPLRETLQSFRQKNEKALVKVDDGARHALLKDADKYCKIILGRLSQGHGFMKSLALVSVVLAGAIFMSQNMHSWDFEKLSEMLNFY